MNILVIGGDTTDKHGKVLWERLEEMKTVVDNTPKDSVILIGESSLDVQRTVDELAFATGRIYRPVDEDDVVEILLVIPPLSNQAGKDVFEYMTTGTRIMYLFEDETV